MLLSVLLFLSGCKTDLGDRYTLGNLEIYFTKDISKKYVEGLGEYFKEKDLILDTKHAVQITSDNESFILRMILNPQLTEFPNEQKELLAILESDIKAEVFNGHNFRIEISDGNFNPILVKQ